MKDRLYKDLGALVERHADLPASTVELLQAVPEEEIWLQGQRSEKTRRAYRRDVTHFIETLGITDREELRQVCYRS